MSINNNIFMILFYWKNTGVLDVYLNKIHGTIPSKFADLKNLQILLLSSNDLSGSIPETLLSLDSMRKLSCQSNKLTGTIPYIHEKYELIRLNTNYFSGPIPVIDCKMSRLRSLWLFNNKIKGTIPETIVYCTELEYCEFSFYSNNSWFLSVSFARNKLSGTIPQEIFTLPVVGFIDLSDNSLIGTIPSEIANGSSITHSKYNISKKSTNFFRDYSILS